VIETAGTPEVRSKLWRAAIPIAAGVAIALAPAPQGLDPHAWRYFAAFVAVILSLITEPLPAPALGLIAVTFIAMLGLPFSPAQRADPGFRLPAEALRWTLSGFANGTVWLIFSAFVVAMGYERTRLGRRIALFLVKHLGGKTLGLGYAITLADLVLAPFTPSNTARSAGTIFPIIRNVPELYGSRPGESPRAIGAYLMWLAFATTCVTSSMFMTALAPNLLAVEMVKAATGIQITWTTWLVGFLPVGVLLVLLLPYVTYKIYPPAIRESIEVTKWAASELDRMGRMSAHEAIMASLVVSALALWIFGASLIDPTMVALAAIAMMLLTGVVEWDDIVGHKAAWNVLVWFATLVILADGLGRVGFIGWFGTTAAAALAGHSPTTVMVSLVSVFFLVHYTFASLTAHTTAVLPAMLAAGLAVPGMPIQPFALLLGYSLGIMGVITPYATGPAPVYFASGFIPRRDFWRLGLIYGAIYLGALLLLGVPWLMMAAS
jgi:L-tartrate/succinate antiporter